MNQIVCIGPLDPVERTELIRVLGEADLMALPIATADDLRAAQSRDTIPTLAIISASGAANQAIRDALAEIAPDVPTLILFEADALIGGDGVSPRSNDEILIRPCPAEAIRWRVEAMLVRAGAERDVRGAIRVADNRPDVPASVTPFPSRACPIIVVFSAKGGVGKTTVATNLAMALQVTRNQRVLLVDGDTITGHVASSLSLQPPRTLAEALGSAMAMRTGSVPAIDEIAVRHPSGLMVAALAADPLQADALDPAVVIRSIDAARPAFDAIVIDTHPEYGALNRALLAAADRVLVPVTPDIPALRAAVQLRAVASELRVADRLALVINRANSGVSRRDIESAIGLDAIAQIRSAGQPVLRAANEGRSLVERFPKEKVTEDFLDLAERVVACRDRGEQAPSSVFRGIFGSLREPVRA